MRLGGDARYTYPAGIADAGTSLLGFPASINNTDMVPFSAKRRARTHPAVPPLFFCQYFGRFGLYCEAE